MSTNISDIEIHLILSKLGLSQNERLDFIARIRLSIGDVPISLEALLFAVVLDLSNKIKDLEYRIKDSEYRIKDSEDINAQNRSGST